MEAERIEGREAVLRCTDTFVDALKSTSAVQRFIGAAHRFESDQEVQTLMGVLRQFQLAQQAATISRADLQEVRDAQIHIRNHPVVVDFLTARDEVGMLLQETNRVISEVLGLDFGQTAGPAGGSC